MPRTPPEPVRLVGLPRLHDFEEDLGGWKGPDDLSAVGYVMWDDANLYFACKVTDDKYANPFTDGIFSTWKCDSIQMAFDMLSNDTPADAYYDDDDQEINLALTAKGPWYWRRTFGKKFADKLTASPDGQVPGAKLAVMGDIFAWQTEHEALCCSAVKGFVRMILRSLGIVPLGASRQTRLCSSLGP